MLHLSNISKRLLLHNKCCAAQDSSSGTLRCWSVHFVWVGGAGGNGGSLNKCAVCTLMKTLTCLDGP